MPGEKDDKNKSIVFSGGQGLIKYSSDLIRRGLDLVEKIEQKDKSIIPCRKKITPENAAQVRQLAWLNIPEQNFNLQPAVFCVKFSPDGNILAVSLTGSTYGLFLCDRNTLDIIRKISTPNEVRDIAFSPDGTLMAFVCGDTVGLHRVSDGFLLHEFREHTDLENEFCTVAFSPDGTYLAAHNYVYDSYKNDEQDEEDEEEDDEEDWVHWPCCYRFWRVSDGSVVLNKITENIKARAKAKGSTIWPYFAFSPDGTILPTLLLMPYGYGVFQMVTFYVN